MSTETKPVKEKKSIGQHIKELCILFWTMAKIGVCTFGGGYAMVSVIYKELGEKKHWIDEMELLDYIAIAQITPGVIAVNVSTFVGRKRKGIAGALAATLGVIAPSIVIILVIAALLTNFADNEYVMHAFAGIRVCVCALVINAAIGFIKKSVIDLLTFVIFLGVFVVAAFTTFEVIYIVLIAIGLSVILTLIKGTTDKGGKK